MYMMFVLKELRVRTCGEKNVVTNTDDFCLMLPKIFLRQDVHSRGFQFERFQVQHSRGLIFPKKNFSGLY